MRRGRGKVGTYSWQKREDGSWGNDFNYPDYPHIPGAAKYRKIPRDKLTAEQRSAYAETIETAIRELQRKELHRALPEIRPSAESGTWANMADGSVGRAIRAKQSAELLRYPDLVRGRRTPRQWHDLYEEAMKDKRAREGALQEAA